MKMPISRSNAFRRSILAVATVRKGDPNATLNAYPVTRRPACGIVTPRSPATSGNSPMMTNSVVPMPNEARARANKGRRLVEAGALGARGMIALQQDDRCPARWTDEASHLHLCCLLTQALPSALSIVGGRAGEQSDTETLRLDRKRHLQEVNETTATSFPASTNDSARHGLRSLNVVPLSPE